MNTKSLQDDIVFWRNKYNSLLSEYMQSVASENKSIYLNRAIHYYRILKHASLLELFTRKALFNYVTAVYPDASKLSISLCHRIILTIDVIDMLENKQKGIFYNAK